MEITTDVLLEAVTHVADRLARRLAFGYLTPDDMRQEVYLLAVKGLPHFDPAKASGSTPAERFKNFLYIHVRNKVGHMYRDKYHRSDAPCLACAAAEWCQPGGCRAYRLWRDRNAAKACLCASASGRATLPDRGNSGPDDVAGRDLLDRLQDLLPASDRGDLRRLLAGARFPKGRRAALLGRVREALGELGVAAPDAD